MKRTVRAPRIPKGESQSVTIANQEKQISLLIDRCEELRKERDQFQEAWLAEKKNANEEFASYEEATRLVTEASRKITRIEGWQDCARELLGLQIESVAPGA